RRSLGRLEGLVSTLEPDHAVQAHGEPLYRLHLADDHVRSVACTIRKREGRHRESLRNFDTELPEQRGGDSGRLDRSLDASSPGTTGRPDDQGHAKLSFEEGDSVTIEMVLAELLPVVRGEDDHGVIENASLPQSREEHTQLLVQVRHGSVVEI